MSKSIFDTSDFVGESINARLDMWTTTCHCDNGVYCTFCEIALDSKERIEMLESILCAQSFDKGMVQ